MVIVVPAVVVSVIVMLDLARRVTVLDDRTAVLLVNSAAMLDDRTAVLLVNNAVMVAVKMVLPPIDIPHVDLVDMPGGGVVEEFMSAPFAALEAGSWIAISVADSPVVAHMSPQ